jgi:nitrogen regulatory protein PII
MKMVIFVYNASIEDEVRKCMNECGVDRFTRAGGLHGRGGHSEPHMGTHIWPSTNSMIMIVCGDETADRLLEKIKELKERFRESGVKAFLLPVEESV